MNAKAARTAAPDLRKEVDSFRNILRLERAKGYRDIVVYGGLDRFLQRKAWDLARALNRPDLGQELSKTSYSRMGPQERQHWVAQWLALLEPLEAGPSPNPPVQASLTASPPSAAAGAAAAPPARPRRSVPPPKTADLDAHVTELWGVNKALAGRLRRLGVRSIRDLLYLLPRRHNDFSRLAKVAQLRVGQEQTVSATVWEARAVTLRPGLEATEAVVGDETGNIRVVWFGRPYLARSLPSGAQIVISGKVETFNGQKVFNSPEYELLEGQDSLIHTGRLVPVYPLTEGLSPRTLRRLVWRALDQWCPAVEDHLPADMVARLGLPPLSKALMQAHYPDSLESLDSARRRLAFDELLLLQLAVLSNRRQRQQESQGVPLGVASPVLEAFLRSLPFTLTEAQERALEEVLKDMARGTPPMSRLLQGDVGSGKTVVALAALLVTVASGYQGSIMVPTEVLAEQHFATVCRLLGGAASSLQGANLLSFQVTGLEKPLAVGLLTGSVPQRAKRELQRLVSQGDVDIVIGTHALLEERVQVPKLALAVVDEQHRFGVLQRATLRVKGQWSPHVLVMSATPIPRTLAFTLYGDLDISTIDQLPPGRQRIATYHVEPHRREDAYRFIHKEVEKGRQAFIICPLIDESEAVEARAATEEYRRLSEQVFPDLSLGLLHGRMSPREKERVMRDFRDGRLNILVSTAVVEVGIDVPNATVMLIEGADRFGLAQLHQFRGRVGRGEHPSYCLLLADDPSEQAKERLRALERVHDGFRLAEVDMELRGPGDFFGTRQSGLPSLRLARLRDQELLKVAREEAQGLLDTDPGLKRPEHGLLAKEVARFFGRVTSEVS